jgi:hypothetical protein
MTANAIATLTAACAETLHSGQAVLSWPSVPVEIVRAAGLNPFMMRSGISRTVATPAADLRLEPGIFPGRLRRLVDAALTGGLSGAACVVVPRTSDPDYKCFLYLREFARLGLARALPPVLLFDLLQSQGPDVRAYNAARTSALLNELAAITGRRPLRDDVRREITASNAARAAARRLAALRRGKPRAAGTEAFPLLGAFWTMPPEKYAALAGAAADDIACRAPLPGLRVLLAGAPVDGAALHTAIESYGAIVVAEAGPWGSAGAGDDVDSAGDPVAALADHYCRQAFGARTPACILRAAIAQTLGDVDAVVVSLPPDDAVFGWDYPALRDLLERNRIPHTCLRSDPDGPLTAEDDARLGALLSRAVPKEVNVG